MVLMENPIPKQMEQETEAGCDESYGSHKVLISGFGVTETTLLS